MLKFKKVNEISIDCIGIWSSTILKNGNLCLCCDNEDEYTGVFDNYVMIIDVIRDKIIAYLRDNNYHSIIHTINELDNGKLVATAENVYMLLIFDITNLNNIIIDYAHTPDAMEKIISTVKIMDHNKIITIFGCGGNREKEKRPKMGEIASLLSDYVILTNDNPRDENPKEIIREIKQNMNNNYKIIYDRKKAIQEGIKMLKENDVLLILGKGHEEYQIIDNKKIFFSDLYTVYDII